MGNIANAKLARVAVVAAIGFMGNIVLAKEPPAPQPATAPASPAGNPAPLVVKTTPEAFANDVDPSLDKIAVTFDRPMIDKSWSFTGGGETFPQRVGEISYDPAHTTCTMPVKIQPGKVYWVGVNSPSHKDFTSADGTPAARYVILFATQSADGKLTPLPEDLVKRAGQINAAAQPTTRPTDADKKVALKKAQDAAESVKAAVPAAEQWLKLVDDARYGDSWDAAAELLRNAVGKDALAKQLAAARNPMGKLLSRKQASAVFATSLPGAPDGQYVVIQFEAVFENKKQAVETVTPMKDKDGKWRVSGYYIR